MVVDYYCARPYESLRYVRRNLTPRYYYHHHEGTMMEEEESEPSEWEPDESDQQCTPEKKEVTEKTRRRSVRVARFGHGHD